MTYLSFALFLFWLLVTSYILLPAVDLILLFHLQIPLPQIIFRHGSWMRVVIIYHTHDVIANNILGSCRLSLSDPTVFGFHIRREAYHP